MIFFSFAFGKIQSFCLWYAYKDFSVSTNSSKQIFTLVHVVLCLGTFSINISALRYLEVHFLKYDCVFLQDQASMRISELQPPVLTPAQVIVASNQNICSRVSVDYYR